MNRVQQMYTIARMAVYHFTLHAYRSWRADHPRGYTVFGEGYRPANEVAARCNDERASQKPATFSHDVQVVMLQLTHDICVVEHWRLEAVAFDPTHAHVLLSWKNFQSWEEVQRRLKNLLSLKLNQHFRSTGRKWFSRRHGAPRGVRDRAHYDQLVDRYFPSHRRGIGWRRGDVLPEVT